MFSKLQSESTESHNEISSLQKQCTTASVTSTASNNLERPGRESEGTYINWRFDDNEEFYLIPFSKLKKMVTKLNNLDVTGKTQKEEAMFLIDQLRATTESISVMKNCRFPLDGDYYSSGCKSLSKFHRNSLQRLYDCVEAIDNDCVNVNYNHSKSVISNVFTQIVKDKGWTEAYEYALNHFALPIKSPQSRLDKYLKLLCCFENMDKDRPICWFEVYDVTTFEAEYGLTWKDDEC